MHKVVDKQWVVFQHDAAFEAVAVLQGGVFTVDSLECTSSLEFDNAYTVGQPADAEPVARHKILDFYGDMASHNVRLGLGCLF